MSKQTELAQLGDTVTVSSDNVGIGISSPSKKLDVDTTMRVTNSAGSSAAELDVASGSTWRLRSNPTSGTNSYGLDFIKGSAGTDVKMSINSSGNVGIGTSSPSQKLTISGGTSDVAMLWNSTDTAYYNFGILKNGSLIQMGEYNNAGDTLAESIFNIEMDGNKVGIGTTSPAYTIDAASSGNTQIHLKASGQADGLEVGQLSADGGSAITATNNNYLKFGTNNTERMRLDSSGNLLVGKTSASVVNDGIQLEASGTLGATRDGDDVLILNRKSSDGNIAVFRKDNTTVGIIGVANVYLTIGKGDTGLVFNDFDNAVQPWNVSSNSGRDNGIDLGHSNLRFDDIYATNGTIQTSDRNEKQDIAELTEAEQRVAIAAKGLLRKFRWKSAVAEKGDNARTHFGIIAQDLQAAFEAEGLDAGDYAMFISSTWTDEETGEERTRLGVRYSELLAFIIGAL